MVETRDSRITARPLDSEFPDWRKVSEGEWEPAFIFERDPLRDALKAAKVVGGRSPEGLASVRLRQDGDSLTVSVEGGEHGDAELSFTVERYGDRLEFSIHADHLLTAVSSMGSPHGTILVRKDAPITDPGGITLEDAHEGVFIPYRVLLVTLAKKE